MSSLREISLSFLYLFVLLGLSIDWMMYSYIWFYMFIDSNLMSFGDTLTDTSSDPKNAHQMSWILDYKEISTDII